MFKNELNDPKGPENIFCTKMFSVSSAFENKDRLTFNDEKLSFECPHISLLCFQMQMCVELSFELKEGV